MVNVVVKAKVIHIVKLMVNALIGLDFTDIVKKDDLNHKYALLL